MEDKKYSELVSRIEKIEGKLFPKKKQDVKIHRSTFVVPDDIDRTIFDELIEVRKSIFKKEKIPSINFSFSIATFMK